MPTISDKSTADSKRYLIVNADDFGQSHGINQGVTVAMDHGIVTSASLMVRWPSAGEAAHLARHRPAISLGLHIDIGEWIFRDGEWTILYQVVPSGDGSAVAAEVDRQLAAFRRLAGNDPTHLDSHQHVHQQEPVRGVVLGVAERLGVPVRHCSPRVRHCGAFYGQTGRGEPAPDLISVEHLIRLLEGVPTGTTELCCHPGRADDHPSMYRAEREIEVQTLCDPRVRAAISDLGIQLCSYRDVAAA